MEKIIKKILFFIPEDLLSLLLFEVKSFIGRLFTGKLKIDPLRKNYINLGSAHLTANNFINIDFFFFSKELDYTADLRFPLKIDDQCIEGIFCEHTFEHLTYENNKMLFKECYRILKPGGIIRIILPDVSLFINNYTHNNIEWFKRWEETMFTTSIDPKRAKRKLQTPIEAISFITQEYGHRSAWDFEALKIYLENAGFSKITKKSFREGEDEKLLIDSDLNSRRLVSIYVEAKKAEKKSFNK